MTAQISNCDCRQCADVEFFIAARKLDTNAITKKFIEKEVEEILAPVIGVLGVGAALIPGVGEVIAAGAAFSAAGLDLANKATEAGIDIQPDDQFVHAINGALCLLTEEGTLGSQAISKCMMHDLHLC